MISKQNNIEAVEKRLQFTMVLGLFFPVLLEALYNYTKSDIQEVSGIVLKAGLVISVLIINYLVFEWRKNKLTERQLNYLSWTFFATIACYACVFLFLGVVAGSGKSSVNFVVQFLFTFFFAGAMYIPLASIGVIAVGFFLSELTRR